MPIVAICFIVCKWTREWKGHSRAEGRSSQLVPVCWSFDHLFAFPTVGVIFCLFPNYNNTIQSGTRVAHPSLKSSRKWMSNDDHHHRHRRRFGRTRCRRCLGRRRLRMTMPHAIMVYAKDLLRADAICKCVFASHATRQDKTRSGKLIHSNSLKSPTRSKLVNR